MKKVISFVKKHVTQDNILSGLSVASDIVPKLPMKEDSIFQVGIKLIAIADSFTKRSGLNDPFQAFVRRHRRGPTEAMVDPFFVSILTHPGIKSAFTTVKVVRENWIYWHFDGGSLGQFFLKQYTSGRNPEFMEEFEASAAGIAAIESILFLFWQSMPGGLHVDHEYKKSTYGLNFLFSSLSKGTDPVLGAAAARLEALVARHKQLQARGISRAYLFAGPPGGGKTTFAAKFAERITDRTLCFASRTLAVLSIHDVDHLLSGLRPEFLIAEDIDHCAVVDDNRSGLFTLISHIKNKFPEIGIAFTANDTTKFAQPLLRPGRIDEILMFDLPDANERKEILSGYFEMFRAPTCGLDRIVAATEGLTPAFLRFYAMQCCENSIEDVLEAIATRRKICGVAVKPEAAKKEAAAKLVEAEAEVKIAE